MKELYLRALQGRQVKIFIDDKGLIRAQIDGHDVAIKGLGQAKIDINNEAEIQLLLDKLTTRKIILQGQVLEVEERRLGGWGEDIHKGYKTNEGPFATLNSLTKDRCIDFFHFHADEPRHLINPIDNGPQGTYIWAQQVGFLEEDAARIAYRCNNVDFNTAKTNPVFLPTRYHQSWHFNRNYKVAPEMSEGDSRFQHGLDALFDAIHLAAVGEHIRSVERLGEGLHPPQDMFAHTDSFVTIGAMYHHHKNKKGEYADVAQYTGDPRSSATIINEPEIGTGTLSQRYSDTKTISYIYLLLYRFIIDKSFHTNYTETIKALGLKYRIELPDHPEARNPIFFKFATSFVVRALQIGMFTPDSKEMREVGAFLQEISLPIVGPGTIPIPNIQSIMVRHDVIRELIYFLDKKLTKIQQEISGTTLMYRQQIHSCGGEVSLHKIEAFMQAVGTYVDTSVLPPFDAIRRAAWDKDCLAVLKIKAERFQKFVGSQAASYGSNINHPACEVSIAKIKNFMMAVGRYNGVYNLVKSDDVINEIVDSLLAIDKQFYAFRVFLCNNANSYGNSINHPACEVSIASIKNFMVTLGKFGQDTLQWEDEVEEIKKIACDETKDVFVQGATIEIVRVASAALLQATKQNDYNEAEKQLKAGATVSIKDDAVTSHGWTAIHWAAFHNNLDMLKLIFQHSPGSMAFINQRTSAPYPSLGFYKFNGSQTPLIIAAANRSQLVCSYLLELGADPTLRDVVGKSASDHLPDAFLMNMSQRPH
ncbi:MAG: ankyrin repeat domain-containing protein [Gammaproteobacteria bacterium]|nr:ankyrin repeat domain-containing protein [Gammaproteobacteria bacterium]